MCSDGQLLGDISSFHTVKCPVKYVSITEQRGLFLSTVLVNYWYWRLATYSPLAITCFVYNLLLNHNHTHSLMYTKGSFQASVAEFIAQYSMVCKTYNIWYPTFHWEDLTICNLEGKHTDVSSTQGMAEISRTCNGPRMIEVKIMGWQFKLASLLSILSCFLFYFFIFFLVPDQTHGLAFARHMLASPS